MYSVCAAFSLGLYDRLRGSYLDHPHCKVEWNHADNDTVGGSTVVTIQVRNFLYSRVHRKLCEVFMNFHEHFLKVGLAKVHFANISREASRSVREASQSGRELRASQSFLCTLL